MATCGGLKHFFEKPFSDNSTILDSTSSWNQIKSMKSVKDSSFTEIFEELNFKENSSVSSVSSFSSNNLPPLSATSSSSSSSSTSSSYNSYSFSVETIYQSGIEGKNRDPIYPPSSQKKHYKHSDSFSSRNSDCLSLCTEGLGFESSDDVEDIMNELSIGNHDQEHEEIRSTSINNQGIISHEYSKIRSRTKRGSLLPPPISCIGRNGKPCVCFESFRENGRFILKEVKIPEWEFLHACREDGRLKLHIVQSDDEFLEEDEEYDDDDSEDIEEDESSEEVTNDDDDDDDDNKKREVGESC